MAIRTVPSSRRALTLLAVLAMTMLQLQLVFATTASGQSNACQGAFGGSPSGTLAMTASRPDGATVAPGETISFRITWATTDWSGLDQFHNCFLVNGSIDGSLTYSEVPPVNDGLIEHSVAVPGNLANGDTFCARARLSGQPAGGNTTTQKSNRICYTIGTSTPGDPDVVVTKSSNATNVIPGARFTYTLQARNVGTEPATGVKIEDTIPAALTIISVPGNCTTSGQKVTCDLGGLAVQEAKSVSFTVEATTAACPKVDNFGTVSATNEPADKRGNNTSNTVTVNVTCPDPDVLVRKSENAGAGGVFAGESFTYRITVENVGGATANNVLVHDTIPADLVITDMSSECSRNGQDVTCDLGSLAAGAQRSVTITVRATEGACPEVTNHATVTAGNEPTANTGNNRSGDVTTPINCVQPGISVRVVKTNDANNDGIYTDSEIARREGLDVDFRLVITNTGDAAVRITDLTDSFEQTVIDLLAAKCSNLNGRTLEPGESATCDFTVRNYSPPQDRAKDNVVEVCVRMVGGTDTPCDDDPSRVRSDEVLGRTLTPPPTRTPPGGIVVTGSDGTVRLGLLAMLGLLLGSGLVYSGYRRRARYDG